MVARLPRGRAAATWSGGCLLVLLEHGGHCDIDVDDGAAGELVAAVVERPNDPVKRVAMEALWRVTDVTDVTDATGYRMQRVIGCNGCDGCNG